MEDMQPEPRVMQGVILYLAMRGRSAAAADLYMRAFGATDMGRMDNPEDPGRLMHPQVEINGGALMMTDHGYSGEGEDHGSPMPAGRLQLVVQDGQMWFDRAVTAGCKALEPFARQFWGDDWGMLEDPFGIKWAVLTPGMEAQK